MAAVEEHAETTYRLAIRKALSDEMRADPRVVVLGEDVGAAGGVFKVTEGLVDEFGPSRVRDTPISETAIIGAALGAALNGARPVVELMFADFAAVAMDQLAMQIPKYRYLTDGQVKVPLVVRAVTGAGLGFGAQHSNCVEAWFMHIPGWRVVAPSSPSDAYWLLRAAIRCDDPVLFFEHKALYTRKGRLDDAPPPRLGSATIRREGEDVTLVATLMMVERALEAASRLSAQGISVTVIDLRSLAPWDRTLVLASVRKTGRLVTVEENPRECGWGAEVVATVAEELAGAVRGMCRITAPSTPVPYSPPLETAWIPSTEEIVLRVAAIVRPGTGLPRAPRLSSTGAPGSTGLADEHGLFRGTH